MGHMFIRTFFWIDIVGTYIKKHHGYTYIQYIYLYTIPHTHTSVKEIINLIKIIKQFYSFKIENKFDYNSVGK